MGTSAEGSRRLNLKWFYVPVLLLIGLLMVLGALLLSVHFSAQNQSATALVSTAQQRLVVQTIAFVSSRLVLTTSDTDRAILRDQLNRSIEMLVSQHTFLAHDSLPDEIAPLYFDEPMHIDQQIHEFIDAVRTLVNDPAPRPDTPAYQEMIRLQPVLQTGINAIMGIYQSIYTTDRLLTRNIALGVLLGILITLVGAVVFIFRPLERLLHRNEQRQRQTLIETQTMFAALGASESRFRTLTNAAPVGIFMTDPHGKRLFSNDYWCELSGITEAESLGDGWRKILHPDERERITDAWYLGMADQKVVNLEYRYLRPDGKVIWVQGTGKPIYDAGGAFQGYLGAVMDITARVQAETALRERERFIDRITTTIPDVVYVYDLVEARNVYSNHEITQTLGYTPSEVQAMGSSLFSRLIHPDDLAAVNDTNQRFESASDDDVFEVEYRMKHVDGKWRWLYSRERVMLRDATGKVIQKLGIAQDITERKRLQEELLASEERLSVITETVPDLIFRADRAGNLVYANPAFQTVLGLDPQEIIGQSPLLLIHPDDQQPTLERFISATAARLPHLETEFRVLRPDGTSIWMEAAGTFMYDLQGLFESSAFVARDITERKRLQEELRASEERLRLITDRIPDMVTQNDAEGRVTFVNPALQIVLGYEPEALMGKPGMAFIHPDDLDALMETASAGRTAQAPSMRAEVRLRHADGHYLWAETTGTYLYDAQARYIGAVYITRDISERRQLQAALRANEEHLRLITDSVPDLISQLDEMGCYTYASPSFQKVLGCDPASLIGKWGVEMVHPDDVERMTALYQEAITTHPREMKAELRLRHVDGHYIWVESTGTYLYDEAGNYRGGVFVARDITDSKRLQEELRASEEQLRLITNNVPDLISRIDEADNYTFASPSYHTVLGYEPLEMVGLFGSDIVHPDDIEAVSDRFREALESRQQMRTELRMRHVDGYYVQFETIGTFLFDDSGKYSGSVYIARDITERKRLQEALIEQEKLMTALEKEQELNHLKNRMMLRIDHEFRTPLTVIRSMAYTLDAYADRLSAEQRSLKVDAIQRQVERIVLMLDAIRSVLTGAYASQRNNRLSVRLVELCSAAIRDVEAHFGTSGRLLMTVPDDLMVSVDPQSLKEVIYKVIVNALLYSSPPDLVHIAAELVDGEVELRVIDRGIGILENEQPRIFEPFFRGSNIGEVSGIGLGLTIAKASVESYGGRIEIDSQPDQGTTVRLCLLTDE